MITKNLLSVALLSLVWCSSSCCMDPNNMTIHEAAKKGNIDRIRQLIQQNSSLINAVDTNNQYFTPLHIAAMYGITDVGEYLVNNGANVNAQATHNYTPLHIASMRGQTEIALLLLQHKAYVDATTDDYSGGTPLHLASVYEHLDIVHILLQHYANINAFDKFNGTPLWWATHEGHPNIVMALSKSGANVNIPDWSGETPLHIATQMNRSKVAIILLRYGADVTSLDHLKRTPLKVAQEGSHLTMTQLFVDWPLYKNYKIRQRTKILAFCLAQHKRLGGDSTARVLPHELYRYIGQFIIPENFPPTIEQIHKMAEDERIYQIWINNKQRALIKPELALIKK